MFGASTAMIFPSNSDILIGSLRTRSCNFTPILHTVQLEVLKEKMKILITQ